jgi:hypothetical protein
VICGFFRTNSGKNYRGAAVKITAGRFGVLPKHFHLIFLNLFEGDVL